MANQDNTLEKTCHKPWFLFPLVLLSLAIVFIAAAKSFGGNLPILQEKGELIDRILFFCALLNCVLILIWKLTSKKEISIQEDDLSLKIKEKVGADPLPQEEVKSQAAENPHPEHLALIFMTLLQEKGRLVDFIMEDISQHSDEQVSAACRVVHQGCKEVILDAFGPLPVSTKEENSSLTLEEGFSPREFKIVGNIDRKPPFSGTLLHKGWRASKINLPKPARVAELLENPVISPAEIELT